MLNHIWWILIVVSLLVAGGNDAFDEMHHTYRNGDQIPVSFRAKENENGKDRIEGDLIIPEAVLNNFYEIDNHALRSDTLRQAILISNGGTILLDVSESSPLIWQKMAKGSSSKGKLSGKISSLKFSADRRSAQGELIFEQIHFIKLKAVTQAAIDFAATAVEIALGLIGVMALWLGLIKIAEKAGLVKVLSRLLAPVTKRIFPEIPPDHPAMGSIIMNVAANMLGLNNAATPLGLKAMEELNSLNPKPGTATNAMVTFLAINTGGLILIPATAIAVRAASGSANPGIIIGTSIFGAFCATVAGVTASKVLEKMPWYRTDSGKKKTENGGDK
jgi:spore maturation protein A